LSTETGQVVIETLESLGIKFADFDSTPYEETLYATNVTQMKPQQFIDAIRSSCVEDVEVTFPQKPGLPEVQQTYSVENLAEFTQVSYFEQENFPQVNIDLVVPGKMHYNTLISYNNNHITCSLVTFK